jgi:hypothetical protein
MHAVVVPARHPNAVRSDSYRKIGNKSYNANYDFSTSAIPYSGQAGFKPCSGADRPTARWPETTIVPRATCSGCLNSCSSGRLLLAKNDGGAPCSSPSPADRASSKFRLRMDGGLARNVPAFCGVFHQPTRLGFGFDFAQKSVSTYFTKLHAMAMQSSG